MDDLTTYCRELAQRVRSAARALTVVKGDQKNAWLLGSADALEEREDEILQANQRDMEAAAGRALTNALAERRRMTPARLRAAADGLRQIAALPDPVGRVSDGG